MYGVHETSHQHASKYRTTVNFFRKNYVAGVVLGSGSSRAYLLVVELILMVVSASLLKPEERGFYVAGIGLLKTMAVLSTFSLAQIGVHGIASAGEADKKKRIGLEAGNLLSGGLFFYVVALLMFFALGLLIPSFSEKYVYPFHNLIVVGLPIYLFEAYFYLLLTSTGQLNNANLSIVIGKTINWIPVLVSGYVIGNLTTTSLLVCTVFGQSVILGGYLISIRKTFRAAGIRIVVSLSSLFAAIRSAVRLYPTIIGSVVFSGLDTLFVYSYAGTADASTYQIALQGIAALSVLPFAIAQYGYSVITAHGVKAGWLRYRKVLLLGLGAHIVAAAFSIFVATYAKQVFFGEKYPGLLEIYSIMAIGSPGIYMSLTMAPMWISRGFFVVSSSLSIATSLIIIPTTIFLLQHFGVRGAAFAFIVAQAISMVTNTLMIYFSDKNAK